MVIEVVLVAIYRGHFLIVVAVAVEETSAVASDYHRLLDQVLVAIYREHFQTAELFYLVPLRCHPLCTLHHLILQHCQHHGYYPH